MRTLLSATAIVFATLATASCAPVPTGLAVSISPVKQESTPVVAEVPQVALSETAAVAARAPREPEPSIAAPAEPRTAPTTDGAAGRASASALFGARIVSLHNQVRWDVGVQPVTWDSQLADDAEAYAAEMARTGRWAHSAAAQRPGEGENLWMGTRGAFSLDEMVRGWSDEGKLFRAGAFPKVSKTGNWDDVGHYTQMIWPGSTRVGCAVRSSPHYDYLVCRYSPAGNVMGSKALETASVRTRGVKLASRPVTSNSTLD